ncbi:MAG TPA: DUF4160 domain-containing protein [Spirochaetota bacterium]|nr:DUF4160 domain-containing protein [Spirochaetota bacterium]
MLIISRFFGIIVYIYWKDHQPPHFHAKYQDNEVTMEIKTGKISGNMSKRGIKLIDEWRKLHIDELLEDWKLAEEDKKLKNIKPLE